MKYKCIKVDNDFNFLINKEKILFVDDFSLINRKNRMKRSKHNQIIDSKSWKISPENFLTRNEFSAILAGYQNLGF